MSDKGTNSADSHCTGVVKWFNNRAGYGFVTAADGEKEGTDIFVHHSSIVVEKEQYKYLVQGEYVEFLVTPTEEGDHEVQASDIRGMRGGKLMCETRFDNRRPRRPRRQNGEDDQDEETGETQQGNRRGGGGPRDGQDMGSTNRRPRNNRNNNRNRNRNNKEQEASS